MLEQNKKSNAIWKHKILSDSTKASIILTGLSFVQLFATLVNLRIGIKIYFNQGGIRPRNK